MEYSFYEAPWGALTLASEDAALVGLWTNGQKYYPQLDRAVLRETAAIAAAREWLDDYFAGKKPPITGLKWQLRGSDFRSAVWSLLCAIPYGSTVTYGQIAKELARRRSLSGMSAQAVGGAVGHNPVSIIVPCHRVVGTNGSLTGYAGGLEVKRWLLRHEGVLK